MSLKFFSRRSTTMEQIGKRLGEIESTYGSVLDGEADETQERLMRLRYGTTGHAERTDED